MKVRAYGKLNLTLDVLGRRPDGYHLLDTVMQSISVWDELDIQTSRQPGVHLQCNKDRLPTDSKNTVYRAAKFFLEDCGLADQGVYIFIKKYIPSRSGMGGGSADAAAALRGLNEMFKTGLTTEQLMAIGARVGADVPFCVMGGAARCTGVGANVEPVAPLPDCWLVVCKPPVGARAPPPASILDQYPLSSTQATPRMLEALEAGNLKRVAKCLGNRFDETIRLAPVRALKRAMVDAGALGSMMTGSGSSVYGIFVSEDQAREALETIDGMGRTFIAQPCSGI